MPLVSVYFKSRSIGNTNSRQPVRNWSYRTNGCQECILPRIFAFVVTHDPDLVTVMRGTFSGRLTCKHPHLPASLSRASFLPNPPMQ